MAGMLNRSMKARPGLVPVVASRIHHQHEEKKYPEGLYDIRLDHGIKSSCYQVYENDAAYNHHRQAIG
jgi:hypothetical protein